MLSLRHGKSLIIYLMVRFNLIQKEEENNKILIVNATTSLVEQLYKDFKDYGYDSLRECTQNISRS